MITHRHFVSRSTGDDLSTISSAWPNWAVSPLFSPTTTLVYWVDSLPPDTDSQISPARTPPKAIDSDFPRVRLLLASITDLAGGFSLGCGKFPPSAIPAAFAPATQFSVDPRHPSRGSHFRSLPSTIREPYCTFQHMAIIPQHLVPLTLPTAKCN